MYKHAEIVLLGQQGGRISECGLCCGDSRCDFVVLLLCSHDTQQMHNTTNATEAHKLKMASRMLASQCDYQSSRWCCL
jgi:hypothetical protein